jgi:NADH-quinone oxidoreductase subunit J
MTAWIYIFSFLTVLSALGVVFMVKPLNSAMCLVATLILVAVHFALLGAEFLAALQILIYAGAIMVLVIFVIMLLGSDGEVNEGSKFSISKFLAFIIGGSFFALLALCFSANLLPEIDTLGMQNDSIVGSVDAISEILFTKFVFSFELIGLLLLAAVMGAVMLALESKQPLKKGRGLRAKQDEAA